MMAEAGADVVFLEMMVDQANFEITLEATKDIGLPVWAGPQQLFAMLMERLGSVMETLLHPRLKWPPSITLIL